MCSVRSPGTGHPVWHLVLRVSISLPPPWQPNVYMAKIPRSETSPGQAKSFLMISWHCGRVVSGSHPPLLRASLCPLSSGLEIAMVRPRSVNSVQRGENVFAPCRHKASRSFNRGSDHWHQEPPAVRNVVPKAASPGRAYASVLVQFSFSIHKLY